MDTGQWRLGTRDGDLGSMESHRSGPTLQVGPNRELVALDQPTAPVSVDCYDSDGISNPLRYSRVSSLSAALSFSNVSVLPLNVRP